MGTGRSVTEYNFENVKHAGTAGYDVFYETDKNGNIIMDWASGNPGFALTDMNAKRDTFPTLSSSNGYKGNCVKLVTRSTGDLECLLLPVTCLWEHSISLVL